MIVNSKEIMRWFQIYKALVPIIEKQDMNLFKLSKENLNEEKSIKDNIISPSSAVASQKSK